MKRNFLLCVMRLDFSVFFQRITWKWKMLKHLKGK
jgi:hypothetical protein